MTSPSFDIKSDPPSDQGGSAPDASGPQASQPGSAESTSKKPKSGKLLSGKPWSSNLAHRVLAGVPALAGLLALVLYASPVWIALVVAVAGVWGLVEYLHMFERGPTGFGGSRPVISLSLAAALLGLGGLTGSPLVLNGALAAAVVWNVLCCMFKEEHGQGLPNTGIALAGLVLVPWMVGHVALIVWLPQGRPLLLFLIAALTLNDTLAYGVGTLFGRHPLMPAVSPNKTIEGSLGGLVGGAMAGALAAWLWPDALQAAGGQGEGGFGFWSREIWSLGGWGAMIVLGMAMAWTGQLGDLMESKLKRINGVKDSGLFLPGHGGILDRLDAYLLAAPTLYYLVLIWAWVTGMS